MRLSGLTADPEFTVITEVAYSGGTIKPPRFISPMVQYTLCRVLFFRVCTRATGIREIYLFGQNGYSNLFSLKKKKEKKNIYFMVVVLLDPDSAYQYCLVKAPTLEVASVPSLMPGTQEFRCSALPQFIDNKGWKTDHL